MGFPICESCAIYDSYDLHYDICVSRETFDCWLASSLELLAFFVKDIDTVVFGEVCDGDLDDGEWDTSKRKSTLKGAVATHDCKVMISFEKEEGAQWKSRLSDWKMLMEILSELTENFAISNVVSSIVGDSNVSALDIQKQMFLSSLLQMKRFLKLCSAKQVAVFSRQSNDF